MALFLAALFLLQGIPLGAGQGGTVSGVLRGADGKPLAYVRVAAVSPPETINDRSSAAMSGLAETDEQGRYSIEGIPQGRYYIAAGRVDFPTYHPGTQDMTKAMILSVMPGVTVSGIDFVMTGSSVRTPDMLSMVLARPQIPIQVRVEGGGKIPVFSGGKVTTLELGQPGAVGSTSVSLSAPFVTPISSADQDVRVNGLPEGYVVQSLTYGSVNLLTKPLSVPAPVPLFPAAGQIPPKPPSTITLVLKAVPPAPSPSGVRVTGRVRDKHLRSVYLSGTPGTSYADGTFEFHGVPPGKHVLAGLDTPFPLGALVVVGDRDVVNVELLDDASPVPFDLRKPRDPEAAGAAAPGSVIPLASVRGTILDEVMRQPIAEGKLKITGYARTESFTVQADGKFEIPRLFPGSYNLDFEAFGHEQLNQTLTVGTENITLDLTPRRLY